MLRSSPSDRLDRTRQSLFPENSPDTQVFQQLMGGVSQEICDDLRQGDELTLFSPDGISTIVRQLAALPYQTQVLLRPLLFLFMTVFAQGCMSTNQPNFEDQVGVSPVSISHSEMSDRETRFLSLLNDPSTFDNPALQTGINDCQRNRMKEVCSFLFEEADKRGVSNVFELFQRARDTLGMMNFDRYDPEVIQEALLNYEDPERHKDKPVVLVFMSRKDHEQTIFDIQALNVESGRIADIVEDGHSKLILVEVYRMSEIQYHMKKLEERGIIRPRNAATHTPGNVAAVVFGTHADEEDLALGISRKNAHELARMNLFLQEKAPIILAACETHNGGYENHNIANVLSLVWTQGQVIANPDRVVGIDFTIRKGILEYVKLESLWTLFTLGLVDDTILVDPEQALQHQLRRLRQDIPSEVPDAYIEQCVRQGILNAGTIETLHGCCHGSGPYGLTSPQDFRRIMNAFPESSDRWRFIRSRMPLEIAEGYAALGIYSYSEMRAFRDRSLSPETVTTYLESAREADVERSLQTPQFALALALHNVSTAQALPFLAAGIREPHLMKTLIEMQISAPVALEWNRLGLLTGPFGHLGSAYPYTPASSR